MEHYRYKESVYISERSSKCSLVLTNVIKVQNKQTILNGVNLTAYSGKICAILGEMNCGKSALMSCLVGGDTIDKGQIWVLGGPPRTKSSKALTNNVGYMPQKICLYNSMTIQELFMYFGQLYNINHGFIRWRISYYNDMFSLPQTNTAVGNLSLSQKRMISFLLSVFHRPRLLVLDEPTVGLDFFKQHKIWKYLNHMCVSWKPTVIVATNSVEEAFLATKIAYMKNGKIIFEKKVEEILHNMIPDQPINVIVEELCNNSMSESNQNVSINLIQAAILRHKKLSLCKKIVPRSNIWKLQTLICHKLKMLTKNTWMFILVCMIPLLQVILHCTFYGKYPHSLPIAILNQETDCVKNPCERIEHCTHFSCHLLNVLTANNVNAEYYNSELSAKNSVAKGLTLGFMRVPEDYTSTMKKIMSENMKVEELDALSKSGIYVEINMTTFKLQEHFKQQLFNAQKLHLIAIYSYYNLSTNYANIPMKVYEYANLNLTENTISQIISCAIFSSAMFYSALSIQSEIQNGYLIRNIIAGVTIYEILLSFFIAHSIISTLQAFSFFFLAELLLNISWHSSLLLIVQLNIGVGFCGMNIGLLIGSLADDEVRIFFTILIVLFENIIISDIFWPLNHTTPAMMFLTLISPLNIPLKTVNAILIGGRHQNEFSILVVIYFIFWTIISLTVFIIKFKNKINFII